MLKHRNVYSQPSSGSMEPSSIDTFIDEIKTAKEKIPVLRIIPVKVRLLVANAYSQCIRDVISKKRLRVLEKTFDVPSMCVATPCMCTSKH